ncbi:MAG: META domain-containing protein [Verrucomicrobiales bacterium]|nr:META domain-containing protein [Verrucomicrobiales bacterium]
MPHPLRLPVRAATRAILLAAFATLAAATHTGCASRAAADRFEPASETRLATLRGVDLRLRQLVVDGDEVDATKYPITLRLGDGGKVTGRSAVNRYFGGFELGKDGAIGWPGSGLGMTRMAGPADAMLLESRFAKALTATTRLATSPDGLRFESKDGKQAVEFQR